MQNLNEIVNFYLTNDSSNALMITGDWGIGKTYYFKNTLESQIGLTPTFTNNNKKYKPLLISLFGLKSIEEVQTEILLSMYPLLKDKRVKLGLSIGKSLFKGIMQLKGLGEYTQLFTEIESDKNDWINFNELVICFDDFERLSENLKITELVGFINSLVENKNIKVIILANENKIDEPDFAVLKEKIIGNTVEFIQDLSSAFDNLIEIKFTGFQKYQSFLIEYKDYILEVFKKESNNLRILSFILTYFQYIHSSYLTDLKKDDILNQMSDEVFKKILKYTIAIGIEYKKGEISLTKTGNIEDENFMSLTDFSFIEKNLDIHKQKNNPEEKTYHQKFKETYYKGEYYNHLNSIYNFITGGHIIKGEDLIENLKKVFHIEQNTVLPQYDILNKLKYPQVFELENFNYKKLTRELLSNSDKGEYKIDDYMTIFYFISRFNNPLKFNLEKLEKRIIRGMKKGKDKYSFYPSLDFYLNIDSESIHKESLQRIKRAALDINSNILKESNINESKKLEDLYISDINEFCLQIVNKDTNNLYSPILKNFSARKFYLFFIKSNGQVQWKIVQYFGVRYPENFYSELKHEAEFIKKLHNLITKKKDIFKSGPKYTIFYEFNKILENAIIRFTDIVV